MKQQVLIVDFSLFQSLQLIFQAKLILPSEKNSKIQANEQKFQSIPKYSSIISTITEYCKTFENFFHTYQNALQKEIQSLEAYCLNKTKGCDWEGTLRNYSVRIFYYQKINMIRQLLYFLTDSQGNMRIHINRLSEWLWHKI